MTNDEILDAVKIMRQRLRGELSALRSIMLEDLIEEAMAVLATEHIRCRPRAEIERDIERELTV